MKDGEEFCPTADEIDRISKALREEKFREMLHDYVQEISDPENRKRYMDDIKLLERERGYDVDFIHPIPFKTLETSVDGKEQCFINICANEKVGTPESKPTVSEDGHRGQCWSLPYITHYRRENIGPEEKKIIIYDVVFHPDTLHMANKYRRFMDMVENTAIQGIQDAFNVILDKNNLEELETRYKGTPEACVIKKPIPGYEAKKPSGEPDPFTFPYPDEKRPQKPPESYTSDAKPKHVQIHEKLREETTPKYSIKYRSFIDLQDSSRSPRPKEIEVTIHVPLLWSVTDVSLEVNEKSLILGSKKPVYSLILPLAYPVNEDKAEAKFNKQKGQLIVTLPVLPSNFRLEKHAVSVGDGNSQEDDKEKNNEKVQDHQENAAEEGEEGGQLEDLKQAKEEEEYGGGEENMKRMEGNGQERLEEEKLPELTSKDKQLEKRKQNKQTEGEQKSDLNVKSSWCDASTLKRCTTKEEENTTSVVHKLVSPPTTIKQHSLISAKVSCGEREEEKTYLTSSLESTPNAKPSDIQKDTEMKRDVEENIEINKKEAAFQDGTPSEESQTILSQVNMEDGWIIKGDVESSEQTGADDEPIPHESPPVVLREIDVDGNEMVTSDHSTSAEFSFQNILMYELD
ncbi:protein kintoun [Pholidichthys leucotaenia]